MEEAAAALPDDVLLEVLARVEDVVALFRCAMVCMRWRGLIADRSFLRRRWPDNVTHPSFLVGFFTQRRRYPRSEDNDEDEYLMAQDVVDPDSPPVFIPAPRSVLGHRLRLSSSGLLHGAMPLVARRGLLLVRLAPIGSGGPFLLAVCDLLAGRCDMLPPLQCDDRQSMPTSYVILTGEDCRSSDGQKPWAPDFSTFFKVVAIGVVRTVNRDDFQYSIHVFSSAEPGWATSVKLAAPGVRPYVQPNAAVCRRGMAHWLCGNCLLFHGPSNILTVDTDCNASLVELSLPAMIQGTPSPLHLAILDGTLSLFCLYRKKVLWLETWTWRGDPDWHLTTVAQVTRRAKIRPDLVCYSWLGENRGTLLNKVDSRHCNYIPYFETGEIEELSSQFDDTAGNIVSIEIDWPALFMSRLVGRLLLANNCGVF